MKNETESYVRIGGEGLEKSYVPLHGKGGGCQNCQNPPYVINEYPLALILNKFHYKQLDLALTFHGLIVCYSE